MSPIDDVLLETVAITAFIQSGTKFAPLRSALMSSEEVEMKARATVLPVSGFSTVTPAHELPSIAELDANSDGMILKTEIGAVEVLSFATADMNQGELGAHEEHAEIV